MNITKEVLKDLSANGFSFEIRNVYKGKSSSFAWAAVTKLDEATIICRMNSIHAGVLVCSDNGLEPEENLIDYGGTDEFNAIVDATTAKYL